MKKYEKATDTTSMLTDYADYMEKYADYMEKLDVVDEKELSTADAAYYVKVSARITKRLAKVAK